MKSIKNIIEILHYVFSTESMIYVLYEGTMQAKDVGTYEVTTRGLGGEKAANYAVGNATKTWSIINPTKDINAWTVMPEFKPQLYHLLVYDPKQPF